MKIPRVDAVPAPVRPRLSTGALLLILGVAVLVGWVGISKLRIDTASGAAATGKVSAPAAQPSSPAPSSKERPPAASEEPPVVPPLATAQTRPVSGSSEAKPPEPQGQGKPGAPPSSINEVVPDVPVSARNTIRGTIRVSVRVTVDREGKVLAATAETHGPSRYFERLSVEAARKWTFTPAKSEEQRTALVTFDFTRAGTVGRASSPP